VHILLKKIIIVVRVRVVQGQQQFCLVLLADTRHTVLDLVKILNVLSYKDARIHYLLLDGRERAKLAGRVW
jgi:hypothetical protein